MLVPPFWRRSHISVSRSQAAGGVVQQGVDAAGVGVQYAKGVRSTPPLILHSASPAILVAYRSLLCAAGAQPRAGWLQALDEVSPYVKSAADTVSPYVKTAVDTVRDVAGPAFRQAQPQLQVPTHKF
jgi:hypothetical protein